MGQRSSKGKGLRWECVQRGQGPAEQLLRGEVRRSEYNVTVPEQIRKPPEPKSRGGGVMQHFQTISLLLHQEETGGILAGVRRAKRRPAQ